MRDPIHGAMTIVPSPGHTLDHHSVCFDRDSYSVLVAGVRWMVVEGEHVYRTFGRGAGQG